MIKCLKEKTAEKVKGNVEGAILIVDWFDDMDYTYAEDASMKLEKILVSAVMNDNTQYN